MRSLVLHVTVMRCPRPVRPLPGQFWSTPSSEVEDMRMMSSTALAVSAMAFLAA